MKDIDKELDNLIRSCISDPHDRTIAEAKQAIKALIATQVQEADHNAYGKGFNAGWTARDNAVDTGGAKPMSQKTKDRIADLKGE